MGILEKLTEMGGALVDYLRPDDAGHVGLPVSAARAIAERQRLSEILPYRDIADDGFFLIETEGKNKNATELRLGFTLRYWPFSRVGSDSENQLEGLIASIKTPGAVLQFGVLSSNDVKTVFDDWTLSRNPTGASDNPVAYIAEARRKHLLASAIKYSLLSGWSYHPKNHVYLCTLTVPYTGSLTDEALWRSFTDEVKRIKAGLIGTFKGLQMGVAECDGVQVQRYLQEMLNPHVSAPERLRNTVLERQSEGHIPRVGNLVARETRMTVRNDGLLHFQKTGDDEGRYVACVTVDGYPHRASAPQTAWLTCGDPLSAREHISLPFWAYLNLVVQNTDDAADRLALKSAGVARQMISDSPSYRAMMSHLYEMGDEVQALRGAIREGSQIVYGYMGVNLIGRDPDALRQGISELTSAWKRHGFRASPERYIHLPVWLASLPGFFTPDLDPTHRRGGLQRGSTMTTRHAALLMPAQGEWQGTPPQNGGLMMLSRRGQPAAFNIQDKKAGANYNFVVIAKSGSGKSFVSQELVIDFLAKGGFAFVIDAGRSYYEMCELLGGTNLVFKMDDPLDLNPFSSIDRYDRLKEMMEMLRELVRYMAFPQSAMKGVDDWQETIIESAIEAVWQEHQSGMNLAMVAEWLTQQGDPRASDIADQLRPYTHGRLADWFNGKGRKVDMKNTFTVVEMDDLKGQGMFRNIVLSMVMQRIAETMYGAGDPSIPKLMMIDEAWDLLGQMQSGDFIERAYRTYRKYGGSAGIITQGFNDLTQSKAAMAAYANSSWLFALAQKAESLDAAFKEGLLIADDALREQLKSVHTAPGEYSEIFVRSDIGQGIYRFITDAYTYWLYTSGPTEKAARKQALDEQRALHPEWNYGQHLAAAVKSLADKQAQQRFAQTPDEVLAELGEGMADVGIKP
ncbi:TraC family protein [Sinimarinibacterium sp. NLF-5-8]|uniref:TraG/VirB4 family ATPase n=1 Tax=Sinimarinibacterium sp. NLF-5-8 TaxID=2698684 RepID=UPI00137C2155|nr:TraC family protein [Sinimarinibacterium sp. NLF-5-8]QHS09087.1 TraC family protein [Sinimarinibacterium sp. NLF-5-8]